MTILSDIPYRRAIIACIIRDHGTPHHDYVCMAYPFWQLVYSIKAIICLLLDREYNYAFYAGDTWISPIATLRGGQGFNGEYTQHWAEYIGVGYGILRNWYYIIEEVSD